MLIDTSKAGQYNSTFKVSAKGGTEVYSELISIVVCTVYQSQELIKDFVRNKTILGSLSFSNVIVDGTMLTTNGPYCPIVAFNFEDTTVYKYSTPISQKLRLLFGCPSTPDTR